MGQDQDIGRYEGFLKLDPDNATLLIALGDLYQKAGRLDEALACYDRSVAAAPGQAIAHGRRAEVFLAQQRFAEAEQVLRLLLADSTDDPALLHNLGLAVYHQERWEEAAALLQQARTGGLLLTRNSLYLAYALHRLARLDEALALCKQALAEHHDDTLDGYVAVLELDAGNAQTAHAHASEVLKRSPRNADAAMVCGLWHIERQEMPQARRHIDLSLREKPRGARAWLARGLIEMHAQHHDQAIAALEQARAGMPDHLGTVVTLGWARFAAGDLPGAERTFREAVEQDGSFAEAHGGLAVTLMAQDRADEARREAQIARRLNPENLEAIWVKGAFIAAEGRPEAGAALIREALQRPLAADGRSLADHIRIYTRTRTGSKRDTR